MATAPAEEPTWELAPTPNLISPLTVGVEVNKGSKEHARQHIHFYLDDKRAGDDFASFSFPSLLLTHGSSSLTPQKCRSLLPSLERGPQARKTDRNDRKDMSRLPIPT
ncbi:uncharacterized protein PADG_12188 [Paracoccidioides brasiliensis Pb18]|uniref:Uncharacterized protein n=1 Tax=Paracoccidioides brasiliensis (strain Pb18) TaxID=502780 RepID=A0A0A0HWI0_PARBD|nr:uncharacterized protein PADG_12188 [Paracoccidioides brasiliensis Pb18]KGM91730.1 hypothetical protein PADG_12188 [Paracoccidioides brasiliensis Pb18]